MPLGLWMCVYTIKSPSRGHGWGCVLTGGVVGDPSEPESMHLRGQKQGRLGWFFSRLWSSGARFLVPGPARASGG